VLVLWPQRGGRRHGAGVFHAPQKADTCQQPLFFSERFGFFLLAGGLCAPSGLSFLFVVSAFSNPEFEMDSYPFAIAEVKSEDTSPFEIAQLS
jgi:hypothetical protein